MERLKKIVDASPGVQIVLSSSWRQSSVGIAKVNEQLNKYGISKVIDVTRIRNDEYLRHEEVLHWIKQHPTTSWIAIDDLPMPQLKAHYIQTEPHVGLTDQCVRGAIKQLNQVC